jgi:hypothetical protein
LEQPAPQGHERARDCIPSAWGRRVSVGLRPRSHLKTPKCLSADRDAQFDALTAHMRAGTSMSGDRSIRSRSTCSWLVASLALQTAELLPCVGVAQRGLAGLIRPSAARRSVKPPFSVRDARQAASDLWCTHEISTLKEVSACPGRTLHCDLWQGTTQKLAWPQVALPNQLSGAQRCSRHRFERR